MKSLSKTLIGIFIVLFSLLILCLGYNYRLNHKIVYNNKLRIDSLITQQHNWTLQLNQLKTPIDSVKLNGEELLFLKQQKLELENKIVEQGRQINRLSNELKESHQEWYTDFLKYYGIIGLAIGFLGVFGGIKYFQDKMMNEMATILKLNKSELKEIWEAKIKNRKLRDTIKIKVLAEKDSKFSEAFKKVMKIFNVDTESKTQMIWTEGLNEVHKLVKCDDYDILIIENRATEGEEEPVLWPIADTRNLTYEELENNLKETCGNEKDKLQNAKSLIQLADKIFSDKKKKAIIYYGDQNNGFPINLVNKKFQHRVTFANAASQLYGNINNMIQFLHEIEELKTKV